MKQKILVVSTYRPDLRDQIFGWDNVENPDLVQQSKPIGLTPSERCQTLDCPLRYLANGWRLLGPPLLVREDGNCDSGGAGFDTYAWWFYQDC